MIKNLQLIFCFLVAANFSFAQITIKDSDLEAGQAYTWTKDNVYLLDGYVFLEAGGILNIEAGTVIKGLVDPTNGSDNASALIIGKGAQIFAEGTADAPIIFTAEDDDVSDPNDFLVSDRGEWGGLIILGDAPINNEGGATNIEGIPSDNNKATYGGSNVSDNSGVLKYVSIRHGGAVLQANDEINGLTLGGVGDETVIDYIEVIANDDDGIEWFGGTVDVKHAIVAFCADDAMDTDDGWAGRLQYGFVIQGDDRADNGGEHDGGSASNMSNFSDPVFANCTYIGSGSENNGKDGLKNGHALHFKEKAGGAYYNSIFTEYANQAIEVEDIPSTEGFDAYENMQNDLLIINNNIWWNFGEGGNSLADFILITNGGDDADASDLIQHILDNNNSIEDPLLGGISRTDDNGLDPTLQANSPAADGAITLTDTWFDDVPYQGAFGTENWALGWTATDEYGFFGDLVSGIYDPTTKQNLLSIDISPNPAKDVATILLDLEEKTNINISIYNITGALIDIVMENQNLPKGKYTYNLDVNKYNNGLYFISFSDQHSVYSKKIMINK
jgi:hypothetical protein